MHTVEAMIQHHPHRSAIDTAGLAECIRACFECAQACTACADACLAEDQVQQLVRCIRLNLDCFDTCVAMGNILSRQTEPSPEVIVAQLQACAIICKACGDECARHAEHMGMEHCRVCAECCRRCEETCHRLAGALV